MTDRSFFPTLVYMLCLTIVFARSYTVHAISYHVLESRSPLAGPADHGICYLLGECEWKLFTAHSLALRQKSCAVLTLGTV
ncbi:hypothetical protein BD289DRAFT_16349 [Coniella lustricola]|uniref:Uncharacterized protein n=1 Tax=Coniella lustricola TaxID=2025994 RepID=A0A2T3A3Q5_9PEZI|nr:hypothetical protein BD289DRAFT_16349 [Coniella lustricola]